MIQVGLTLKSISSQQVQTEHQNIRLPNAIDRYARHRRANPFEVLARRLSDWRGSLS